MQNLILSDSLPLSGLTHRQAEQSRLRHGSNMIRAKKKKSFFQKYLESFGDPIIKILLIALGANVVFMFRSAGWYESVGIAAAVLIATLVSTISEYGSEAAFDKLQQESADLRCRVRRGGALISLAATELVVGDIVLLQSGERIPADGRILEGNLSVDQSSLNGESKERNKYPAGDAGEKSDLLARGHLFQGSVVCSGDGVMMVERIGEQTYYGRLAKEIQDGTTESPLKARLSRLAKTLSKIGYTAGGLIAAATLFNAFILDSGFDSALIMEKLTDPAFILNTLLQTVMLSVSVIVMSVPEGLPMMITLVLSANMRKMLKDKVLVRKLVGIETAGSMNILFTDKTGTLTKGRLQVTSFYTGDGQPFDLPRSRSGSAAFRNACILNCALNTDCSLSEDAKREILGGNATDRALMSYIRPELRGYSSARVLSRSPFDSTRKFASADVQFQGVTYHLIKGAPEILLPRCRSFLTAQGKEEPFLPHALSQTMRTLSGNAVRMLVLAQSKDGDFRSLTLLGLVGIQDRIRRESPAAVRELTRAGIQTVMITGDHKETALAVAKETGLISGMYPGCVYTSGELAEMSDAEVLSALPKMRVVARALPTDKSRLVRIAQESGLVAGMTGDGINDAPALKKADVGFAMGTGTEVAKEAGDIVILDNNIQSIARAVLYGRTIFKSIRKFIIFQLTMNFCAVILSVICPFIGIDAPLTVMQMLWVNMIIDTLAGLAFSGEIPLAEYMREAPKKRDENIMNRYMVSQVAFGALYTTAVCVLFLILPQAQAYFRFGDGSDYFMTAFFALFIFSGIFNCINARTYRLNLFAYLFENWLFILIICAIFATQIVMTYRGGSVFRTTGISLTHLQAVLFIAASVVPVDIVRKIALRCAGRKGHL